MNKKAPTDVIVGVFFDQRGEKRAEKRVYLLFYFNVYFVNINNIIYVNTVKLLKQIKLYCV